MTTTYRVEAAGCDPTTGTNEVHAVAWATIQSERVGVAVLIELDGRGEVSRTIYKRGRIAAVTFAPGRECGIVPPFDAGDFCADADERPLSRDVEWPE